MHFCRVLETSFPGPGAPRTGIWALVRGATARHAGRQRGQLQILIGGGGVADGASQSATTPRWLPGAYPLFSSFQLKAPSKSRHAPQIYLNTADQPPAESDPCGLLVPSASRCISRRTETVSATGTPSPSTAKTARRQVPQPPRRASSYSLSSCRSRLRTALTLALEMLDKY